MWQKLRLRSLAAIVVMAIAPSLRTGSARADDAVLANGTRLHIERHELQGSVIRLFIPGGYVDVTPADVLRYEQEEPPPPPAQEVAKASDLPALLSTAGWRHGLDPALLKSMIAEESNFNSRAVSPKGARGLMQLMPQTGQLLGVKDTFNAAENIQGGAQYIRSLLERYSGDLAKALAAYNAGPATVDRYGGIPPYAETQDYVRRVITRFNREKTKQKTAAGNQQFE